MVCGTRIECEESLIGKSTPSFTYLTYGNDQHIVAILCGELYEKEELRALVNADPENSDSELILRLFSRFGVNAFRVLNGRFAAAIIDNQDIYLATDHAGSIPLYMTEEDGSIYVTTELKALGFLSKEKGYEQGRDWTASCKRLKAAQVSRYSLMSLEQVGTYTTWRMPVHRSLHTASPASDHVLRELRRSVKDRLSPQGEVTLSILSGGVDSGTVTALAAIYGSHLRSYSVGTEKKNEFPQALETANYIKNSHENYDHQKIVVTPEDILNEIPWVIWSAETNNAEIVEYLSPISATLRRIPDQETRILSGYGADIPLGGMHTSIESLEDLDHAIDQDLFEVDLFNEMVPQLATQYGHWVTYPYFDRGVLDLLISLDISTKRSNSMDKKVLREAATELLPDESRLRPKQGVHEGSGTSSSLTQVFLEHKVPSKYVDQCKEALVETLFSRLIVRGEHPEAVDIRVECQSIAKNWGGRNDAQQD